MSAKKIIPIVINPVTHIDRLQRVIILSNKYFLFRFSCTGTAIITAAEHNITAIKTNREDKKRRIAIPIINPTAIIKKHLK